jgi:alpha-mannosidase
MRRFNKLLIELETALWKARMPLSTWYHYSGEIEPQEVGRFSYKKLPTVETPCLWGGYDQTGWFFCDVKLLQAWRNEKIYLYVQSTESLLFVNGEPYQGLDENHPECLLTNTFSESTRLTLAIESYSGRVHQKNLFRSADLRIVHPAGWSLYHALKNAVEVTEALPANSPEAVAWQKFIERTVSHIDPRRPGSEAFLASLEKALIHFEKGLSQFQNKGPITVWPVGHSHIDVAWLWRIKEVQRKCGRTFSTMLRLMDEYPDFRFVQSQPALYAFTEERYPTLFTEIKKKVHEGRWEPVGGMWVEADCNISSGESLVRQILHGKSYFESAFGVKMNTLWLPDVFGYSCALPQIMKKSEIDYFFTSKLMWNEQNKFPYNAFWWQGIDGTRVLSYLMFHSSAYNCQMETRQLTEMYEQVRQRGEVDNVIMPVGYGDGGGGTTRRDLESMTWLSKAPGLPLLHYGSVKAFFKALSKKAKNFPIWSNELYLEKHRGTFTSHAPAKRMNRKCEVALREAEIWSVLAGPRYTYPQPTFVQTWRTFLTTQFHDIIPGSSIPEVYSDAQESYQAVMNVAGRIQNSALQSLSDGCVASENTVLVFNSLSWPRTDVAQLALNRKDDKFHIVDEHDQVVPMQLLSSGKNKVFCLFLAKEVPSVGYATYRVVEGFKKTTWPINQVSRQSAETPFYKIKWNEYGQLERLYDLEHDQEVFGKSELGNVLETYLDYPNEWEAWDLDDDYRDRPLAIFQPESIKVIVSGPICTILRVVLKSKESRISQDIYFYQHLRRIDFCTEVDWHERRTVLKVAFPVQVPSTKANYEIQFGTLERSLLCDTSWEKAKFEVPAQRWADISNHEYGLALMNDCKYGYDGQPGRLRLTLLRSGYCPDPIEPGLHVQYAAPTDDGLHEMTYSIYPHPGGWQKGEVVRRGQELNAPLTVLIPVAQKVMGKSKALPGRYGFIEIAKGDSLCVETLKQAESSEDLVLRVYESHGIGGDAAIQFHFPVASAQECNLMERDLKPVQFKMGLLRFSFSPYDIRTFLLKRG